MTCEGDRHRDDRVSPTDAIGRVLDAFYGILSGRRVEARDWDAFRRLFHPGALLVSCGLTGTESPPARSVEEYIARLRAVLAERDFYERGGNYKIHVFPRIACVESRYEAFLDADWRTCARAGTNLVTLVLSEGIWRIVSMVWQDDVQRPAS